MHGLFACTILTCFVLVFIKASGAAFGESILEPTEIGRWKLLFQCMVCSVSLKDEGCLMAYDEIDRQARA